MCVNIMLDTSCKKFFVIVNQNYGFQNDWINMFLCDLFSCINWIFNIFYGCYWMNGCQNGEEFIEFVDES